MGLSVDVSYLEVYNECLRDLLRDSDQEECKYEIKVGTDRQRTVTNLTIESFDPTNPGAILAVLALTAKRRATASTGMNASSSWSHSVVSLRMCAKM